jgi:hypothetical protein
MRCTAVEPASGFGPDDFIAFDQHQPIHEGDIPMTIELNTHSQPRRTLAQQLDRLDTILDGLSEGLNEAVAEAVGNAVRQAVETALSGIMKNPEILAKLQPAMPAAQAPAAAPAAPKPAERPSWLRRAWYAVCDTVVAVAGKVGGAVSGCAVKVWSLPGRAVGVAKIVALLAWENRAAVAIAMGAGAAVGIGCYLAGPMIAAAVGGLAAGAMAFGTRLWAPIAKFTSRSQDAVATPAWPR